MPTNEAADVASTAAHIHPGVWGILGAAMYSAGKLGVAWIRARGPGAQKESLSDKLDKLMTGMARVERTMATREDVKELHNKIDAHITAHAEGKFNN
jgi:hypothetical protein